MKEGHFYYVPIFLVTAATFTLCVATLLVLQGLNPSSLSSYGLSWLAEFPLALNDKAKLAGTLFFTGVLGATIFNFRLLGSDASRYFLAVKNGRTAEHGPPSYIDVLAYVAYLFCGGFAGVMGYLFAKSGLLIVSTVLSPEPAKEIRPEMAICLAAISGFQLNHIMDFMSRTASAMFGKTASPSVVASTPPAPALVAATSSQSVVAVAAPVIAGASARPVQPIVSPLAKPVPPQNGGEHSIKTSG